MKHKPLIILAVILTVLALIPFLSWSSFAQSGFTWSEDLTYLPDLRNLSGVTTEISLLNTASTAQTVTVYYFYANGNLRTSEVRTLQKYALDVIQVNNSRVLFGTVGSAAVNGGQKVIATVRTRHDGELTIYNSIKGSGGFSEWEQTNNVLFAPVVKNNWYGRYSSIEVVNAGNTNTNVTAYFYEHYGDGGSGSYKGTLSAYMVPNARHTFNASSKCPSGHYCSVRLVTNNGQRLAAVVREYDADGGGPATYNAASGGATTSYAPVIKTNWGNQSGALAVMNTSLQQATVNVTYYDANSGSTYTDNFTIPSRSVRTFWAPSAIGSGPFLGSAYVSSNKNIVVLSAEVGNDFYPASNAFSGGTHGSYITELFNYANGPKSGINVQNLGSGSTQVCVRYYTDGGTYLKDICTNIAAQRQHSFHFWNDGLPDEFYGSALVFGADELIAVMVHELVPLDSGLDQDATFNGSNVIMTPPVGRPTVSP